MKNLEEILENCIVKIEQGVSLEDVLKEYPDDAEHLKELIQVANILKSSPAPEPTDTALMKCLLKVGKEIESSKDKSVKMQKTKHLHFPRASLFNGLVAALFLIFISWGTVNLSAESIPGDILYPIKIFTEKIKVFITFHDEKKIELRIIYSEKRLQELVKHLEKNGNLNIELLTMMLDKAKIALKDISQLPKNKRDIYISKLKKTNHYQTDILEKLKPKIPKDQKKELERAIQTCRNRNQNMCNMPQESDSRGTCGSGCGWC